MVCFEIINGDVEIDPVSFFKFTTNCITRGYKYKLLKQSVHVNTCKFSFANRVFTAWNNLLDVMNVNNFKTCLNAVNVSVSGKPKMATSEMELVICQLLDETETKFRRLDQHFRGPAFEWDKFKYCPTKPEVENPIWRPPNRKYLNLSFQMR